MIVVVGLSHRTAPIGVREKIALAKDQIPKALAQITERASIGEAMLISTCNRVELVVAGKEGVAADLKLVARDAVDAIATLAPAVREHLYALSGAEAVRHLFRVASSLDSLVLGEPQILGQVKEAFETARAAGTVGGCLHRTVPRAIRAAKRVRTETQIGAGQVSVPSVAVDLARQIFGELAGRSVVLIGSGEMAETVAKLLKNAGSRIAVVGRNAARVGVLARAVGGEPHTWDRLSDALVGADVVITSTSAPGYVVEHDAIYALRRKRRGRSLFLIDLAVPRDVDPRVEAIDGVFLYNVDDFSKVVAETLRSREREAELAEEVVSQETQGWERWADAAAVTPAIVALRERFRAALVGELDRSMRGKLKHLGTAERAALETMLDSALNKMLHQPSRRLRELAADREFESYRTEQLVADLTELFALDQAPETAEPSDATAVPGAKGANGGDGAATGSATLEDHESATVVASGAVPTQSMTGTGD